MKKKGVISSLVVGGIVFSFQVSADTLEQAVQQTLSYHPQLAITNNLSEAENISLEAAHVYVEVLHRQALMLLAEKFLATHQVVCEKVKTEEAVSGYKVKVAQTLGRLALARTDVMTVQGELRDAEASFRRIVGTFPTHLVHPLYGDAAFSSPNRAMSLRIRADSVNIMAVDEVNRAVARLRYYQGYRDQARLVRDAYAKQFDAGQRGVLDILDAENALFRAEVDYVNTEYALLFEQLAALHRMGGLLDYLHVKTPIEAELETHYVYRDATFLIQ